MRESSSTPCCTITTRSKRVAIPELAEAKAHVAVAVLKSSKQPQQALHLARYLAARDKGLARYQEFGFQPVEGDAWSEQPEITLYAGSMLRPAIEKTITAFEEREGVRVTRVYNGCGILVAQMKAGQVPDAYFACDSEFMNQVQPLFPEPLDVSQNELVILVKKGNPLGIRSLDDLTKPGLRVGIGHEKQCAMGWLTQRTFAESGLQDRGDEERRRADADRRHARQPDAVGLARRGRGLPEQRRRRGRLPRRDPHSGHSLLGGDAALRRGQGFGEQAAGRQRCSRRSGPRNRKSGSPAKASGGSKRSSRAP